MPSLDDLPACECGVNDWRWTGKVFYSDPPLHEARCVECGRTTTARGEPSFQMHTPSDLTHGWHWKLNDGEHTACLELYDADGRMLAFIKERPGYCDRGHFQVCIEVNLGLEPIDGRALMYCMDLDRAMWETVEFLAWRMHKISYQQPKGGIRAFAKESMPAGVLYIDNLEYQSTRAPIDHNAAADMRDQLKTYRRLRSPYVGMPEFKKDISALRDGSCFKQGQSHE